MVDMDTADLQEESRLGMDQQAGNRESGDKSGQYPKVLVLIFLDQQVIINGVHNLQPAWPFYHVFIIANKTTMRMLAAFSGCY